jgi:hypothetical protein
LHPGMSRVVSRPSARSEGCATGAQATGKRNNEEETWQGNYR